ncbi:AcrR family transcriptional regulator [Leucobacter exalbidus]|uniref:AcrR family transcriptional regulator n=1 Tax=Leucobacter exalbidus TaxID=662960 RepID=A0A940PM59_9MICO|nr:TetR family transcriptional regulator [Leucobacter exalbidus]MBP1325660.1 AcrR family transcriptional regulator [Leucobacter exalbidus]
MPRLEAATVAEHRANQERLLLDVAHSMLQRTGAVPGMGAVAAGAGLARSSIYQYFDSREALLNALVEDIFPKWAERVTGAMAAAPNAGARILAYALANLELVAEGAHAVGSALATLSPGDAVNEQAARMHRQIQEPLTQALIELRVADPEGVGELINAMVHASTLRLEAGQPPAQVRENLTAVIAPMAQQLQEQHSGQDPLT